MDSRDPSEEKGQRGRRRHSRLRTRLPTRLMTLTDTYHVTMFDLSFSGARVAIDGFVRPGGEAVLCWGGFEVFANVAWCSGGYCGLIFEEPLSGNVLIATRDMFDATPRIDQTRVAARAFVRGSWV